MDSQRSDVKELDNESKAVLSAVFNKLKKASLLRLTSSTSRLAELEAQEKLSVLGEEFLEVFRSKSESITYSFRMDPVPPPRVYVTSCGQNVMATTACYSLPSVSQVDLFKLKRPVINNLQTRSEYSTDSTFRHFNQIKQLCRSWGQLSADYIDDYVKRNNNRVEETVSLLEDNETDQNVEDPMAWESEQKELPSKVKGDLFLLNKEPSAAFSVHVSGTRSCVRIRSKASIMGGSTLNVYHSLLSLESKSSITCVPKPKVKADKEIQADVIEGDCVGEIIPDDCSREWIFFKKMTVNELVDYRTPILTGYFRDQVRRIDMVLVIEDTGISHFEEYKSIFLANLRNAGLDMELETGILPENKTMVFVKIHAPEEILVRAAKHYGLFKLFKTNHLQFMSPTYKKEQEIITAIRLNYPEPKNFSTLERSSIVYRILLSTRFGPCSDNYGLNRLLDMKAVKDAYALHDGPYFFLKPPLQKGMVINGRQVLYHEWIGGHNFLSKQPLHTIREYLGERVAFLFAFFQYYNLALILPSGVGVLFKLADKFSSVVDPIVHEACRKQPFLYKEPDIQRQSAVTSNETTLQYDDLVVCPKCIDFSVCPFVNMSNYCHEVGLKSHIDSPSMPFVVTTTVIYFMIVAKLWRRFENYYYWLWEVREVDARNTLRRDYDYTLNVPYKDYFRLFTALFIVFVYLFCIMPAFIQLDDSVYRRAFRYLNDEKNIFYSRHTTLIVVGFFNALFIVLFEVFIFRMLVFYAHYLCDFDTEYDYESAITKQYFMLTLILNIGLVLFYALVKGLIYRTPGTLSKWRYPLGLGLLNCGMYSCIDEVSMVFASTLVFKVVFLEAMMWIFEPKNTEYSEPGCFNEDIPCWEKEYNLRPLTEKHIMLKYNWLMIQLVLITFFVSIFPVVALFALIYNLFIIRRWAKQMLLRSRRPLIIKAWGLGSWNLVLQFIPYAAALCNILTVVRQSNIIKWVFHDTYFSDIRYFADFTMGIFYTSSFIQGTPGGNEWVKYVNKDGYYPFWKKAHFCMYPNMFSFREGLGYTTFVRQNFLVSNSLWIVCLFMMFVILVGIIINAMMHSSGQMVRNSLNVEDMMKSARIRDYMVHDDFLIEEDEMYEEEKIKEPCSPKVYP